MDKTQKFLKQLQLESQIVSSSDPFIVPELQKYKELQVFQKTKYEARLSMGEDESIACASFNIHGVSFTKPFQIEVEKKEQTVTGCVGFGIDRWVLAFLSQYGVDDFKWPDVVKEFLEQKKIKK